MILTNWYVITGAPSSGKTTLINRLRDLGYQTSSEVAREYIEALLNNHHGLSLSDIKKNILSLQRKILSIELHRERCFKAESLIIFDRGTPDSLAYLRMHQLDTKAIKKSCSHHRYKSIFYCHGLPIEHDGIRTEDEASAKKIGELIYNAYEELNYPIIELPVISIEARLQIILAHIEK